MPQPDFTLSDPREALKLNHEEAVFVLEEIERTVAKFKLGQLSARETIAEMLAWFTLEGA